MELTHSARSRGGFALGAVRAAEWLAGRKGMFEVDDFMQDILGREEAMKFEGVYTALVTPFDGRTARSTEKALRRLVDFQIEGGVAGLVPVGTTGESPTLDGEECTRGDPDRRSSRRAGRVPVIAGAGSNCTAEAIHYARDAKEAGAQATLQVTPYYNKPTPDGLLAALPRRRRRGGPPARGLQHRRAHGEEHRQPDHAGAGEAPARSRGQGGERRHRARSWT